MLLQLYTWYMSFHISLWKCYYHWFNSAYPLAENKRLLLNVYQNTVWLSGTKIPPSKDLIGNNFIFSDKCRMHVRRREEGNKTEPKHSKQWWFTKPRILIFSMNHRIMKKNRHVRVMFAMVFCCSVFAFSTCARGLPLIVRAHPFVRWCLVSGSTLKGRF